MMTPEIEAKLDHAQDRYDELGLLLSDPRCDGRSE